MRDTLTVKFWFETISLTGWCLSTTWTTIEIRTPWSAGADQKILSSSEQRPNQLRSFHDPDLRRLAVAPPRLLKLLVRHAFHPHLNVRIMPVHSSPEHSCPASMIVRGHDRDR